MPNLNSLPYCVDAYAFNTRLGRQGYGKMIPALIVIGLVAAALTWFIKTQTYE